jgi:arylsulfatase A-like enzyme
MTSARNIIIGTAMLLLCGYVAVGLLDSPSDRPNILIIMVDDLGYNDLAINNDNSDIDTPNMDQIAREGVRFTRHYATAVCSPARGAFLTGMFPERLGYLPNGPGISPQVITLPEKLKQEGYTTWHIGKWHIGDLERTAWPDHQGFDHWFGFLNQWRLAGKHVNGELKMTQPRYNDPWLEGDSEPGRNFQGHLEDILTDKAVEVMTELQAEKTPWFLNLWFYAPHAPVQPAEEFQKRYPDTPAGRYRALVNQLDANIGRLLSHLDAIGALANTIVVIVSDNGGTNKELDNNAPYRGHKGRLDEGGLRTPLIIRWPDESLNEKIVSDTVSIEDLYPTLLTALGIDLPEGIDGKSFYEGVSQQAPIAQRTLFREGGGRDSYGVLSADGRWRLYQPYTVWGTRFEPRLFDLEQDPHARNWMENPPAAQVAKMKESYRDWYSDVHTVDTDFLSDEKGGGRVSGMDFLRTPGFGGYTIGIGLPDTYYEGQIMAQAGIWSMRREGNTVVAKFGDLVLSGDIETNIECHSVVITGYFRRQVGGNSGPDTIALTLYIDGRKSDSKQVEATLSVANPTVVTLLGDPDRAAQNNALLPPIILNTRLDESTPWTIDAFSRELCSGR